MQIQVHAPWEVNDYLYGVIYEKVEKLGTYYDRIEKADVYLSMGNGSMTSGKVLEIRLAVPGNDLFIKAEAESFEIAVANATQKMRRQLIRHKEQLSNTR